MTQPIMDFDSPQVPQRIATVYHQHRAEVQAEVSAHRAEAEADRSGRVA